MLLYIGLAAAVFIVVRSLFVSLAGFLTTLLVALFVSFAIEPAVDWFAARGWKRGQATALVFVITLAVVVAMVWLMVSLVVDQITELVDQAPTYVQNATDWINERFDTQITTDRLEEQIRDIQPELASTATDVGGRVLSVTGSVIGVLFQMFAVVLFAFYMIAEGPQFRRTVCSVLPPGRQRLVLRLWDIAIQKTGGYLYSRLLLAAVSALFAWIAFTVIGIPSPLALALWLGLVSQFVPVIGTYIGGAFPLVIALVNDPIDALWVLIYIVVYQQFENYFFAPKLTSKTMAIHPAVAFGAVIVGASILGGIGAVLALPAAAIVQAFVTTYVHRYEIIDPDELAEYGLKAPAEQHAAEPDARAAPDDSG